MIRFSKYLALLIEGRQKKEEDVWNKFHSGGMRSAILENPHDKSDAIEALRNDSSNFRPLFDQVKRATGHSKYADNFIKAYKEGAIKNWDEAIADYGPHVNAYHQISNLPKPQLSDSDKNFRSFKSLEDFKKTVFKHYGTSGDFKKPEDNFSILHQGTDTEGFQFDVIEPHDHAVCRKHAPIGLCTGGKDPQMYEHYKSLGPLFIVRTKNPKFKGGSFQMNIRPESIEMQGQNQRTVKPDLFEKLFPSAQKEIVEPNVEKAKEILKNRKEAERKISFIKNNIGNPNAWIHHASDPDPSVRLAVAEHLPEGDAKTGSIRDRLSEDPNPDIAAHMLSRRDADPGRIGRVLRNTETVGDENKVKVIQAAIENPKANEGDILTYYRNLSMHPSPFKTGASLKIDPTTLYTNDVSAGGIDSEYTNHLAKTMKLISMVARMPNIPVHVHRRMLLSAMHVDDASKSSVLLGDGRRYSHTVFPPVRIDPTKILHTDDVLDQYTSNSFLDRLGNVDTTSTKNELKNIHDLRSDIFAKGSCLHHLAQYDSGENLRGLNLNQIHRSPNIPDDLKNRILSRALFQEPSKAMNVPMHLLDPTSGILHPETIEAIKRHFGGNSV